ncbi:MAG: thiolase domain-containing protein [Dissulfuribacterales bacterium]
MRGVSIIGIGSTRFGVNENDTLKSMAINACLEALNDAGVGQEEIGAFYVGNFISGFLAGQATIAPQIADLLGLPKNIAATTVEGACSSGGIAVRQGMLLIAAGMTDFVLAVGVEKMTHASTAKNTEGLALGMDHESSEGKTGLTFPGFFALIARRHMYEFGTTPDHLASVSVKSRENAKHSPRARFKKAVTLEEIRSSKLISDPLRLFDCCPIADGAAAVILCPTEIARNYSSHPIEIIGSSQTTGYNSLYNTPSATTLDATVIAGSQAYAMAGVKPEDIDVVELHDCFTIAEIVDSEDLGLFPKGKGGFAVADGRTRVDGKIPINPSGGLLAKGHPVGATGVGQIYEIVRQLRGTHENQVKDAEIGLTHNLGATGQVATVHIFRRI